MQSNIRCITQACDLNGLTYRYIDTNQNCMAVEELLIFQLNRTPFNVESMAGFCKDKEHHYDLLKDKINMPKTLGFLDYDSQEIFKQYLHFDSQDKVIDQIEQNFDYPLVIKQNKGALGINVFRCHTQAQVRQALGQIYDKQSINYDYVALAQQYIKPKIEFRVIFFDGKPVLSYERVFAKTEFGARYWETEEGKALPLTDQDLVQRSAREFAPAVTLPGLRYVALDIILNEQDELYLLELNSGPQVNHFIQSNGEGPVVEMYSNILKAYFAS
ncbi:MAG: hypothetical protein MJK04_05125 [Psychrosphaera sp.]|nr:hypothetical protein [Psychrosphaera sp.]